MDYFLALVAKDGAVIGRLPVAIPAHGESARVLTEDTPGLGRKGTTVRVAHPLEDLNANPDAGEGVQLALVGSRTNFDGDQESLVVTVFDDVRADVTEVSDRVSELQRRIISLQEALDRKIDKS